MEAFILEAIISGIIAIFISYFIIYGAVRDAIEKKMEKYMSVQTGYLKYLAKQAGMTLEDNDKIILSEKEYRKKHNPSMPKM